MSQAIAASEVEVTSTPVGKWLWREELMSKALELRSPKTIQERWERTRSEWCRRRCG